jgi:hypothetical protein
VREEQNTAQASMKEVTADIPVTSGAMDVLALEAMWRDVGIGKLVAQVLAAAIKKDMIGEILRGGGVGHWLDGAFAGVHRTWRRVHLNSDQRTGLRPLRNQDRVASPGRVR